jgi:DNA-binding response OmpR family regulator
VDLIPKPIDHDALLVKIREILNKTAPGQKSGASGADHEPQPGDQDAHHVQSEHQAHTDSEPEPEPQATSPVAKKILFVDDENDWRYMGSLYLTECGYEVFSTGDAIGALVQTTTFKPDLVVLDLNLGGESGITLMKILTSGHPTLPILIYTGLELTDAEISDLLEQGASECLRKGTMEELLTAVRTALGVPPAKTEAVPARIDAQAPFEYLSEQISRQSVTGEESPMTAMPNVLQVGVQSTANKGDFNLMENQVALPSSPADGTGVETEPEQTVESPESADAEPGGVIESGTESALIISEDAGFTDELRAFLESQSFRAMGVDGAQAVARISEVQIDFILFDMAVPSPQAEQFYQAIEKASPHHCKRIVFMTNDYVDPKSDGFVRRAKAPMLWRPFPLEDLLQTLQTMRSQFTEAV